jgi:SAM-dependent methyltransferase
MKLEPTSERVLEDAYQQSDAAYVVYLFHIATYDYALPFCEGRRVLDFGCGSGYGSARLAARAASVVGVDVADDAVAHANARYGSDRLSFQALALDGVLQFPDASFDVVTSFQVIEHVAALRRYVTEARRVLKPGGVFIVATPDRSSRLFGFQKPWNPWHLVEYDAAGLDAVLRMGFSDIEMLRMGGSPELVGREIARYRRMKLLSLPFTLPIVPEPLRQGLLKFLSNRRARAKPAGRSAAVESLSAADVMIGADVSPSVNLIAIAKN